jgi:putative hydrolase of the HAD superfamily
MPPAPRHVIAFDADDTLWHNETIFEKSHSDFADLLAPYIDLGAREIDDGLQAMVKRNIDSYGYGFKGFTLSMIEAALAMGGDRIAPAALNAILDLGREMRKHPVDLIDGAAEVVTALHQRGVELWLITKGDLFDQESKIARSGLAEKFAQIEIVSEKNDETYRGLLRRHGVEAGSFVMIGNSLRSDILPVCRIGGKAVHIPYHITWAHEFVADPPKEAGYATLASIAELLALLARWRVIL